MPIQTERIESGLYCAHWIGDVVLDDLFQASEEIEQMARADDCPRYVFLVDGTEVKRFPFSLSGVRRTIKKDVIGVIVLNSPFIGESLGQMLSHFLPYEIEFYTDYDRWLDAARHLLERKSSEG